MESNLKVERAVQEFYIDCSSTDALTDGSLQHPLHSLTEVNLLHLKPGQGLLFKRGSVCSGSLKPNGSGTEHSLLSIAAYGDGALPRIKAGLDDEAALSLYNQEFWDVSTLDLQGGLTYGILAGGDGRQLHHIHLHDLVVHDVGGGPLLHKESGLVVVKTTGENGNLDDLLVDGIRAYRTTQWSGIFVAGASHVLIQNSLVHDVQGDGIVAFSSHDVVIARSVAWHTGMQHQLTIGTPNAIWTWRCTDCTVQDNEAFLTDSPGVDGGSFDIDFGNTRNTVKRNFGHDTDGYCVSIFGAFGPTKDSVVADNLCLRNGLSPRLAQRQGAILLMTWQGGTIDGLDIARNRIDWQPPGETPAVQAGHDLVASGVTIQSNHIWSTGTKFVSQSIVFSGVDNRYVNVSNVDNDLDAAKHAVASSPDSSAHVSHVLRRQGEAVFVQPSPQPGWALLISVPASTSVASTDELRTALVEAISASAQFSHVGLQVILISDDQNIAMARDWISADDNPGISLEKRARPRLSVTLVSPSHRTARTWEHYPGAVELGSALWQCVGFPDYGQLDLQANQATD